MVKFVNLLVMFDVVLSFFANNWFYYTLTAIYLVTVLVIMGVILSENRNPVKSLAWVTVLLLFPVVGIVLYVFFGRSIKNMHMLSRRQRRQLKRAVSSHSIDIMQLDYDEPTLQQIRLARSLTGAGFHDGTDITVFTNGTAKFAALERDLSAATDYINLQYYIFENDEVGSRIAQILIDCARRGVQVRVIYDHVGSFHTPDRFFKRLSAAGVEIYPFFKVAFPPFGTRINWRNHRKICVIDGRVGYIGGMNIADRYIDGGRQFSSWRDSHLRLEGPSVASLQASFAVDWSFMGKPLLKQPLPCLRTQAGNMSSQLVLAGPTAQWSNIEFMFVKAIASARKRIYLQTPYFLPTEALLTALQTAALAKVDVRVMMPRRSDSNMLRYASFSYIDECLQAGIKIYLYEAGMLHAKNLIIDDEIASVGSTNFDFRSFEHNFEANLFVYSQEFNQRMIDIFLSDMRSSTRIMAANWAKRKRAQRFYESVLRLLAPIL
jgi:cardiolipin synthase